MATSPAGEFINKGRQLLKAGQSQQALERQTEQLAYLAERYAELGPLLRLLDALEGRARRLLQGVGDHEASTGGLRSL